MAENVDDPSAAIGDDRGVFGGLESWITYINVGMATARRT
jgi:hypothetical protein